MRQPQWVVPELNVVWALDFMCDTLYGGKVFRTLNVIDEANRGALGIDIATSIPAVRVIAFVAQLIDLHGRPRAIRCDNGPELTCDAFTAGCRSQDIELRFIQPGKPDQNANIERFNRTYREEVLSAYLFESLDQTSATNRSNERELTWTAVPNRSRRRSSGCSSKELNR